MKRQRKGKPMANKMTQEEVSKMTDADLVLLMARESLVRYGTALPPAAAQQVLPAPSPVTREEPRMKKAKTPKKFSPEWKKTIHTCPRCGHKGPIDPDFGVRVVRGVELRQSWCSTCRASVSYYDRPRKNNLSKP